MTRKELNSVPAPFNFQMRTEYPAKVLLAWGEAIDGHVPLRDWLIKNGYPELGIFAFALRNKDDARIWLMKNGHAHLLAVITGVEGDARALEWLRRNNMNVLRQVALSGDGNEVAFQWLVDHGHRELAVVSKKIFVVKQQIEEDNRDPHKYSQD
jgi:hypothetical protein